MPPSSFAMAPKSAAAATTTAAAASRRRAPSATATAKANNGRRRGGIKANVARVNGNGAETATATAAPASASAGDDAGAAGDAALRGGMGNQIPSPGSNRTRRRVRRPSSAAAAAAPAANNNTADAMPPNAASIRHAAVSRVTKETSVDVAISLDGTGACSSRSSIPFLDHMMDQLASHGLFDVAVKATGDTWIDDHHTNEDVALALGTALARALGDRRGIVRFGDFSAPLDEALVHVVLDLSGRPHLSCDLKLPTERIGTYETQLVEHFFQSVVNTSGMTLHIRQLAGTNSHHIVEATFKAFARALRQACERDPRRGGSVASSKGVLTQA